MAKNFDEMRKRGRLPERSVDICMRGDLVAAHEQLEEELEAVQRGPDANTGIEGGEAMDIAGKLRAVEDLMREETYRFRLRALPKREYRALKAKHPPRKGDDGDVVDQDLLFDVNMETWQEPLVRACLVDPVLDDTAWAETVEVLSDRQYEQLVLAAVKANRTGVDIPFSRAASNLLRTSATE